MLVKMACTRQVLENMAPNASVKPIESTQGRACTHGTQATLHLHSYNVALVLVLLRVLHEKAKAGSGRGGEGEGEGAGAHEADERERVAPREAELRAVRTEQHDRRVDQRATHENQVVHVRT